MEKSICIYCNKPIICSDDESGLTMEIHLSDDKTIVLTWCTNSYSGELINNFFCADNNNTMPPAHVALLDLEKFYKELVELVKYE